MINRIAAQKMLQEIPTALRNAARAERKAIIKETQLDPLGTSFKTSHGQFEIVNNIKLKKAMDKVLSDIAAQDAYKAENFIQRQPINTLPKEVNSPKVIQASMLLD